MNAMQWSLVFLGYLVLLYWTLRWLRWTTFVPIPGRAQDVRAICRRQTALDVDHAVAEALAAEIDLVQRPT